MNTLVTIYTSIMGLFFMVWAIVVALMLLGSLGAVMMMGFRWCQKKYKLLEQLPLDDFDWKDL